MARHRSDVIFSLLGSLIISCNSYLSATELSIIARGAHSYTAGVSDERQDRPFDSNIPKSPIDVQKWTAEIAFLSGSEPVQIEGSEIGLTSRPYAEIVASISIRHEVNPYLIHALIQVESGYRTNAESPKGAKGLMQLMPVMLREYGVTNPFDPSSNIEAGTRLIKTLLEEFDIESALAAYHAGPGAVRRHGGVPPFPETRRFVDRVSALINLD